MCLCAAFKFVSGNVCFCEAIEEGCTVLTWRYHAATVRAPAAVRDSSPGTPPTHVSPTARATVPGRRSATCASPHSQLTSPKLLWVQKSCADLNQKIGVTFKQGVLSPREGGFQCGSLRGWTSLWASHSEFIRPSGWMLTSYRGTVLWRDVSSIIL